MTTNSWRPMMQPEPVDSQPPGNSFEYCRGTSPIFHLTTAVGGVCGGFLLSFSHRCLVETVTMQILLGLHDESLAQIGCHMTSFSVSSSCFARTSITISTEQNRLLDSILALSEAPYAATCPAMSTALHSTKPCCGSDRSVSRKTTAHEIQPGSNSTPPTR